MNEEVNNKVRDIVADVLQKKPGDLNLSLRSRDVEGWDSLRHVMIIAAVEDAFGIEIGLDELMAIESIGDLCQVVENHQK
ncbi:MAG TPA: acyl carrier protein [Prolixibacteraceae bacterium]|nr:acyl carrier protein [Prolixibacteraceae bacterium]